MKLFGSLRWDGGTGFFIGLRGGGGGGVEKHCTRASLHADTVADLIRTSVAKSGRVWPAGLAKAKDQEEQTTGNGHPRGMWLQWRIVHNTLSHEMFRLTPLKHLI